MQVSVGLTILIFRCGLTACGYDLLATVSKLDGAEVLLFPCNQFGAQGTLNITCAL
jgi:glutathione peroxidase-family protein